MNESGVYVSYIYQDAPTVLPIIDCMKKSGINLCFEEVTKLCKNQAKDVVDKISSMDRIVCFVSQNYFDSEFARIILRVMKKGKSDVFLVCTENMEETDIIKMQTESGADKVLYWAGLDSEAEFIKKLCTDPFFIGYRKEAVAEVKGFDSDEYFKNSEDPRYIKARKEDVDGNYSDAFNLYKDAFDRGNLLAGVRYAAMYYYGNGVEQSYKRAYQLFNDIIEKNNDPLARGWIAYFYYFGIYVDEDIAESKRRMSLCLADLEKLCECGCADAQHFLGYIYMFAIGTEQNYVKAVPLLKSAYESGGNTSSGFYLCDCYINGYGCDKNIDVAKEILEELSQQGYVGAYHRLAKLYFKGNGVEKDLERAFGLFERAAKADYKDAYDYMGDYYHFGYLGEKDEAQAEKWYLKAYDNNSAYAACKLGFICCNKDKDKAYEFFKYAADRGNREALYQLFSVYYCAAGSYKDYKKGFDCLRKAAEAGNTAAQFELGRVYFYEKFGVVKKDVKEGIKWFERSAEAGYVHAQRHAGKIYCFGEGGIEKNTAKGLKWLESAAKQGIIEARCDYARAISAEKPEEAVELFQELIREKYAPAYLYLAIMYMDGSLGAISCEKADNYLYKLKEELDGDSSSEYKNYYENVADTYCVLASKVKEKDTAKWYYSIAIEIYERLLDKKEPFNPDRLIKCYRGMEKLHSKFGERHERKKYAELAESVSKSEYYLAYLRKKSK